MAPRTRSNRVEVLARQRLLASGQIFNASGFAALPDELYLEIISHFPAYPIPQCGDETVNIQAVRDRHLTLFALSQTCRSLRPVFLRCLWQRIEVYDGMDTGRGELRRRYEGAAYANKRYAEELVRQLEVVTVREPSLARHVNFVNVLLTEFSLDTVLAELARCIALFPNLHTVQLCFRGNFNKRRLVKDTFKDTFKAYQYPSIRNVFVCPVSVIFICACREARFVAPMTWRPTWWWARDIFEIVLNECPALEVLGPFWLDQGDVKSVAMRLPKLREITVDPVSSNTGVEFTRDLSKLRHLRTINIRFVMKKNYPDNHAEPTGWVGWAKGILSRIAQNSEDNQEPRKVVLYFDGGGTETHFVDLPEEP